jgi:hypothetical protein
MEARAFAEGQRLLLNEVSGWVIVAFGDAFNNPPPEKETVECAPRPSPAP